MQFPISFQRCCRPIYRRRIDRAQPPRCLPGAELPRTAAERSLLARACGELGRSQRQEALAATNWALPPKIQPSEDLSRARPPRQPERRQKHARTRPEPSRRSQVNRAGPADAVRARGVAVWTGLGSRRAWGCRGRAVRVEAGAEERKRQGGRERKLGVGRLRETVGVSVWWGCCYRGNEGESEGLRT